MFALTTSSPGSLAVALNLTQPLLAVNRDTDRTGTLRTNASVPLPPMPAIEPVYELAPLRARPPACWLDRTVIANLRMQSGGAHLSNLAPATVINLLYQHLFGNQRALDGHSGLKGAHPHAADSLLTMLMTDSGMFAGTDTEPVDPALSERMLAQALVDLFDAGHEDPRLSLIGYTFADDIKARHTMAQLQANFMAALALRYAALTPQAAAWAARTLLQEYRPAALRADAQQLALGSVACSDLHAGIAMAQARGIDHRGLDSRELAASAMAGGELLRNGGAAAGAAWYPQLEAALEHALANGHIDLQRFLSPDWPTLMDASKALDRDRADVLSRMLDDIKAPMAQLLQPFPTRYGMALEQSATAMRSPPLIVGIDARPDSAGTLLKGQRLPTLARGAPGAQRLAPPLQLDAIDAERALDQRFEHRFTSSIKGYEQSITRLIGYALEGFAYDERSFLENASYQLSTIKLVLGGSAPQDASARIELVQLREQVLMSAWFEGDVRHYLIRLVHVDSLVLRLPDTAHDLPALIRAQPDLFINTATRARLDRYASFDAQVQVRVVGSEPGIFGMREPLARLMVEHLYQLQPVALGKPAADTLRGFPTGHWTALAPYRPCTPMIDRESPGEDPAYCTLATVAPGASIRGHRRFNAGTFWRVEQAADLAALRARMLGFKTSQSSKYLAARMGIPLRASNRLASLTHAASDAAVECALSSISAYRVGPQRFRMMPPPLPAARTASMLPVDSSMPVSLAQQLRELSTRGLEFRPDKDLWRTTRPQRAQSPVDGAMPAAEPFTLRAIDHVDHVIVGCARRDAHNLSRETTIDGSVHADDDCVQYAYRSPVSGRLFGPLLQADAQHSDGSLHAMPLPAMHYPVSLKPGMAPHHRIREFHLPVNADVIYLQHVSLDFVDLAVFEINQVLYGLRLTERHAPLESLTSILQRGEFRAAHCRAERGREDDLKCLVASSAEVQGEPAVLLTNFNNPIFQELDAGVEAALPVSIHEQTYLFPNPPDEAAHRPAPTVWHNDAYWRIDTTRGAMNLVEDGATAAGEWPATLNATLISVGDGAARRWAVRFASSDPLASQRAEVFRTFDGAEGQPMGIIYANPANLYAFELPRLEVGSALLLSRADAALTARYRTHHRKRLHTMTAHSHNYHVEVMPRSREVLIRVVNRYMGPRLGEHLIARWQSGRADAESRGEILVAALNGRPLPARRFHSHCADFFDSEICNLLADSNALKTLRSELTYEFNRQHAERGQSIGSVGVDDPRLPQILREIADCFVDFNADDLPVRGGFGFRSRALRERFDNAFGRRNIAFAEVVFADGARRIFAAPSGGGDVEIETATGRADLQNSLNHARAAFDMARAKSKTVGRKLVDYLARQAEPEGALHYPAANEQGDPHLRSLDSEFLILRQVRQHLRERSADAAEIRSLRLVTRMPPCHSCLINFVDLCMEYPRLQAELLDLNPRGSQPPSPVSDAASNPFQATLERRGTAGRSGTGATGAAQGDSTDSPAHGVDGGQLATQRRTELKRALADSQRLV